MSSAAEAAPLAEQRTTLEAFDRVMRHETHNLARRPDLLWQQLYNRLQWEDGSVPAILDAERS